MLCCYFEFVIIAILISCAQSIIFGNGEIYWIQVAKLSKLHVANYQLVLVSQRGYRVAWLN